MKERYIKSLGFLGTSIVFMVLGYLAMSAASVSENAIMTNYYTIVGGIWSTISFLNVVFSLYTWGD